MNTYILYKNKESNYKLNIVIPHGIRQMNIKFCLHHYFNDSFCIYMLFKFIVPLLLLFRIVA